MKVDGEYFTNEISFCTDLYLLDDLGKKPKERILGSTKVHSSTGKCVHCFRDSSKMLFGGFGFDSNEWNVYVEKARGRRKGAEEDVCLCCAFILLLFLISFST